MKNLILLLLFMATVALAYFYGGQAWKSFSGARMQLAEVDALRQRVSEITDARNQLLDRYSTVSQEELNRLDAMLPTSLALEEQYVLLQKLASGSGLIVEDIVIQQPAPDEKGGATVVPFSVRVTGPYQNVRVFADNVENNLRLMDVTSIDVGEVQSGGAIFTITIKGTMYYGG